MHDCEPSRIDLSMLLFVLDPFGFRIGAGKITALLAVKRVDTGALRRTSDHLGRAQDKACIAALRRLVDL
jgi:hypothetical protein